MSDYSNILGLALLCFFIGAIPFGFLIARAKGIDIRTVGSGNIGATNVTRALGLKWGILVYSLDFIKGFVPLMLIQHQLAMSQFDLVVCGVACVLGHNYTPFLKFKGGKGIATSCGVLLAIMPYAFIAVVVIWGILFAITRTVSVASLVSSVALPVAVFFLYPAANVLLGFALILCLLSFWRHRTNIQRLISGEELGFKKK